MARFLPIKDNTLTLSGPGKRIFVGYCHCSIYIAVFMGLFLWSPFLIISLSLILIILCLVWVLMFHILLFVYGKNIFNEGKHRNDILSWKKKENLYKIFTCFLLKLDDFRFLTYWVKYVYVLVFIHTL